MKKITLIIPCYNEEEMLDLFYQEIQKYFVPNYQFTLVFIDDGSSDETLKKIKELSNKDTNIKYISFSRNFGKESAMLAGLKLAKQLASDAAIIIDADLQHPPILIQEMLKNYEEGYKLIYARQRSRKGSSLIYRFFAKSFYLIYAFLTGYKDMQQGAVDFCLIDKDVIDAFLSINDHKRFTKGIFPFVGFEKKCLDFDYLPRKKGSSKWSLKKLYRYAWDGIKQFSHVYIIIPSFFSFVSFILLIYDLISGIIKDNINYLALRIDGLSFIILLTLRYLFVLIYDIRDQSLNRPHYLIKESNYENKEIN